MDRKDIGSWLSGPQIDTGLDGAAGYPGERLGLPESGRGSVTPWGRRVVALVFDWFVVLGVSLALVGPPQPGDDTFGLVNLAVLVLMYVTLLMTAGVTLGMWFMGLAVWPVGSQRLSLLRVAARSVLLALVIPAVIYDRDRRGLHDKVGGTVVVRVR
ncbi:MAG: RDD family protein [Actinomycetia bacterium]|nr:RDD family protein [Actinomycetes bacterium]